MDFKMVKMAETAELPEKPKALFNQNLILAAGGGLLLLGLAAFLLISSQESAKVEIISAEEEKPQEIVVDIAGAVEKPGVYRLTANSRVNDVLQAAGGLAVSADREWVEKNLNLAAPLKDGIKIYIKTTIEAKNQPVGQPTGDSSKININTAPLAELDRLPGIGQVLGQRLIDYRNQNGSFNNIEDLLKVEGISQKVFEKFKDQITVW